MKQACPKCRGDRVARCKNGHYHCLVCAFLWPVGAPFIEMIRFELEAHQWDRSVSLEEIDAIRRGEKQCDCILCKKKRGET